MFTYLLVTVLLLTLLSTLSAYTFITNVQRRTDEIVQEIRSGTFDMFILDTPYYTQAGSLNSLIRDY